jgi:hypothetical protein
VACCSTVCTSGLAANPVRCGCSKASHSFCLSPHACIIPVLACRMRLGLSQSLPPSWTTILMARRYSRGSVRAKSLLSFARCAGGNPDQCTKRIAWRSWVVFFLHNMISTYWRLRHHMIIATHGLLFLPSGYTWVSRLLNCSHVQYSSLRRPRSCPEAMPAASSLLPARTQLPDCCIYVRWLEYRSVLLRVHVRAYWGMQVIASRRAGDSL